MNHTVIFQPPEFRSPLTHPFLLPHLTSLVPNPFNSTQEITFSSHPLSPSYWHWQSLPHLLSSGNSIVGFLTLLYFILFNAASTMPPDSLLRIGITGSVDHRPGIALQSDLNLPFGYILQCSLSNLTSHLVAPTKASHHIPRHQASPHLNACVPLLVLLICLECPASFLFKSQNITQPTENRDN